MIAECIAYYKNKILMKLQINLDLFDYTKKDAKDFMKGYMMGIMYSLSLVDPKIREYADMNVMLLDKEIE